MNKLLCCAVAAGVLAPPFAIAQNASEIDRLRPAIVKVDTKSVGSGIIISAEPGIVRIVTALHVVEGPNRQRNTEPQSGRPCESLPEVVMEFEPEMQPRAAACTASDEDDLALLEVPVPTRRTIPPFRPSRDILEYPGNDVSFLGYDRRLAGGKITVNEATTSLTGRRFTATGSGVQPGFSGGAVVDETGRLIGMTLATRGGTLVTALRWQAIATTLSKWGVRPTLDESPAPPDETFSNKSPQGPRNESARSLVREYRRALNRKDRAALAVIYPSMRRTKVEALFGDAVRIALELRLCSDRDDANRLSCEYQLTVTRRTGSSSPFTSACFTCPDHSQSKHRTQEPDRLFFTFAEDMVSGRWVITHVTQGASR